MCIRDSTHTHTHTHTHTLTLLAVDKAGKVCSGAADGDDVVVGLVGGGNQLFLKRFLGLNNDKRQRDRSSSVSVRSAASY